MAKCNDFGIVKRFKIGQSAAKVPNRNNVQRLSRMGVELQVIGSSKRIDYLLYIEDNYVYRRRKDKN